MKVRMRCGSVQIYVNAMHRRFDKTFVAMHDAWLDGIYAKQFIGQLTALRAALRRPLAPHNYITDEE